MSASKASIVTVEDTEQWIRSNGTKTVCVDVPNDDGESVTASDGSVASKGEISSLGGTWMGDQLPDSFMSHIGYVKGSMKMKRPVSTDSKIDPSTRDIEQGHELSAKEQGHELSAKEQGHELSAKSEKSSRGCFPTWITGAPGFLKVTMVACLFLFILAVALLAVFLVHTPFKGEDASSVSSSLGQDEDFYLYLYGRETPAPIHPADEATEVPPP